MRNKLLRAVLYLGLCALLTILFWKRTAIFHRSSNAPLLRDSMALRNHPISKWSALHLAAWDGRTSDVKRFLEEGADIDSKTPEGETPLHLAAGSGRVETVSYLISEGANVNARNAHHRVTPLHDAAAGGFIEVVEALLAGGADVNARNQRGRTPLDHVTHMMRIRAFRKKLEPCAELLREHAAKQKE